MTAKVRSATFPNATLQQFRELFQPKKEYIARISDMSIKERLVNWKPTTDLEAEFKSTIVDNQLVKLGGGAARVTTYCLKDQPQECKAYMSTGGKALRRTAEGRDQDVGFFLTATQSPDGLTVTTQSKREHYRNRTRMVETFNVLIGLILGILPGLIYLAFILFVVPRKDDDRVERMILPPLAKFLGPKR